MNQGLWDVILREEPLMIWGGLGQKREKKLNGYSRRKGKKVQRLVAEEKKTQREFAPRGHPPQIINGPSLNNLALNPQRPLNRLCAV